MRISQLQSLTNTELSLIFHIINEIEPISSPKVEVRGKNDLLWIKHEQLISKLTRQESKLTEEGKEVFKRLMEKLNKTSAQEIIEEAIRQQYLDSENLTQMELNYEYPTNTKSSQPDFQF